MKTANPSLYMAVLAVFPPPSKSPGVVPEHRQEYRQARLPAFNLNTANTVKTAKCSTRTRKHRQSPLAGFDAAGVGR